MPRRVADYLDSDGFTGLNQISSLGALLLGASTLPFLWNAWRSLRRPGPPAGDDPWGAQTLEWATSSPPPAHNFTGPLPPIRSTRPVWDLRHDRTVARPGDPDDPDGRNGPGRRDDRGGSGREVGP
jgi:cytochrome c oxidase subunit 1